MPADEREQLLRTSSFQVLIGDRELGFAEVSGLTSRTELAPTGGDRRNLFDTVVLRRALTQSSELYDWRRRIAAGEDDRREVTIRQLSAPAGAVANAWRLSGAWPCRWSGPAFNALVSEIAYEELELAFDDIVWLDQNTKNPGG